MASLQMRTQPKEGFFQKVQHVGQAIGTIKSIYDTGKSIYSMGQAIAPTVASVAETAAPFLGML